VTPATRIKYYLSRFLPTYKTILQTGLFDEQYYCTKYPDVSQTGLEPLAHFIYAGCREKRQPHPLFDIEFYLSQLGPSQKKKINPLIHYHQVGADIGLDPHPLFLTNFYIEQVETTGDTLSTNPIIHYMSEGYLKKIATHPLFNRDYFLATASKDTTFTSDHPLLDYLLNDDFFKVSPHPLFDPGYYLVQLQDDVDCNIPLLMHYMTYGVKHGLEPHPLFDVSSYKSQLSENETTGWEPLSHYLIEGRKKGLNPLPTVGMLTDQFKQETDIKKQITREEVVDYIQSIDLTPDEKSAEMEQLLFIDGYNYDSDGMIEKKGTFFDLYQYMCKRIKKVCSNKSC